MADSKDRAPTPPSSVLDRPGSSSLSREFQTAWRALSRIDDAMREYKEPGGSLAEALSDIREILDEAFAHPLGETTSVLDREGLGRLAWARFFDGCAPTTWEALGADGQEHWCRAAEAVAAAARLGTADE